MICPLCQNKSLVKSCRGFICGNNHGPRRSHRTHRDKFGGIVLVNPNGTVERPESICPIDTVNFVSYRYKFSDFTYWLQLESGIFECRIPQYFPGDHNDIEDPFSDKWNGPCGQGRAISEIVAIRLAEESAKKNADSYFMD